MTLGPAELAAAKRASEPNRALAAAVARRTPVLGAYRSGEAEDGSALIHLEGAKGATDIDLDTKTGVARVTLAPSDAVTVMGELHRGRYAGPAWKLVIDASAVLILALSLVGYVLFFSLRFRLRTSLILTAASLALLGGVYAFLTS